MVKPVLRILNNTVAVCNKAASSSCSCLLASTDTICTRCFSHLSTSNGRRQNSSYWAIPQYPGYPHVIAVPPSFPHYSGACPLPGRQPFQTFTPFTGLYRIVPAGNFVGSPPSVSFRLNRTTPLSCVNNLDSATVNSARGKATLPEEMSKRSHRDATLAPLEPDDVTARDVSVISSLPLKYFVRSTSMTDAPAAAVLVPQSSTTEENLEEVRDMVTLGNIQRMLESEQEVVRGGRTAEQPLDIKTDTAFDVWRMNKLCNRRWVEVHHSSSSSPGIQFTMATYNVLAQNLLEDNSYLYTSAKRDWLAWNYRRKNLLAEISFYNPDILCCQEINEQHYVDFFYPEMQKLGYQGAFKKRTRAMHDGCATFFKTSVFECDAFVPVEYLKADVPVLDRDNVALLLLLRPKNASDHGTKICVANTHLLFNPRRGDVKLAQLMTLFAEIDQLAFRPDPKRGSSYHPVLFCGDLNMEPFSRLYEFISEGSLNIDGLNVRSLSGQEQASPRAGERMMARRFLDSSAGITDQSQYVNVCRGRAELVSSAADNDDEEKTDAEDKSGKTQKNPGFTQGSGKISHSFRLKSVYPHIDMDVRGSSRRAVREITTAHDRGNCTVDYIFYSGGLPRRSFSLDSLPSLAANEPIRKSPSYEHVGEKRPSSLENPNDRLQLLSRLELISDCDMQKIGKLPNELISSDHLLLAAKFLLKS